MRETTVATSCGCGSKKNSRRRKYGLLKDLNDGRGMRRVQSTTPSADVKLSKGQMGRG